MGKANSQLVQDFATIHRRIINIVWMTINYIYSYSKLYHVLTVRTHLGVAWKWRGTCWFTDQPRDLVIFWGALFLFPHVHSHVLCKWGNSSWIVTICYLPPTAHVIEAMNFDLPTVSRFSSPPKSAVAPFLALFSRTAQAFLVQNPVDASVWMPGMMG